MFDFGFKVLCADFEDIPALRPGRQSPSKARTQTYIWEEALKLMGIEDAVVAGETLVAPNDHVRLPVKINVDVPRSPSDSHFAHLNILGELAFP
ncbi:hypothetical protein EC957_009578 [Mortierella hygrophila]|uniref:Uncharacterized protein n=1 Tax=Mortierella hygrophila TaxID=979708 RepID=A0A9P6FB33_9FUNG|nr:hypothetical protein EC957_009578 [Mortierella hygrophila]